MGFNHAAAFAPPAPRPKFFPPFEAPVTGFTPQNAPLLNLRKLWLQSFMSCVQSLNPEIPRDVAVEWVDRHFPKTAGDLVASITAREPQKLAQRLADTWEAA